MYLQTNSDGSIGEIGKGINEAVTANKSLTVADSGKTFTVGVDALVITLPATVKGIEYTFINSGANGANIINVAPIVADGISGTITLATAVVVLDGTVNKSAINTKATAVKGDSITLIGTGVTGAGAWLVKGSTGIWARQA